MPLNARTCLVLLLLAGLVFTYGFVIPRAAIQRNHQPITMSPADVGLEYEDIILSPADQPLRLAAWWMPADPDKAVATLVFSHGGGSNRHSQFFRALEFYRAMVAD